MGAGGTLMPLSTAVPKPSPRWVAKAQKRAEEAKQIKATYAAVDRRDGPSCRVCGARVGGLGTLHARHHHHLVYRSKGGAHETANTLSLCCRCHTAVHAAEIRLSGDADARLAESGRLGGVKVERWTEGGWSVERWV